MTIPKNLMERLAQSDEQSKKLADLLEKKADRRKAQQPVEVERRKGDRRGQR